MYNYFEFVRDESVIVYKEIIYTVLLHLLIIYCKRNYFYDGKMDDFFSMFYISWCLKTGIALQIQGFQHKSYIVS